MPGVIASSNSSTITKFTNCRLFRQDQLVNEDLWVSSLTGKILSSQATFFDGGIVPDRVIDLGGRIISPGLIDVQLNGAYGFNFSSYPDTEDEYVKAVGDLNRRLVETGVTSYMPTLTSQNSDLYQKVLPLLSPRGVRKAEDGAESLGAHVEGPFLSPEKNGCHDRTVIRKAETLKDIEGCYGTGNLGPKVSSTSGLGCPLIRKITVAPEQGRMMELIPELTSRGIIVSIGHSDATYEEASQAVSSGATMITHLFNAMKPLHHRNPGIFGLLGTVEPILPRPYFGMIADGIHVHPTAVKLAYNAHPEGFILVTDAMHLVGLPDGPYTWTNGDSPSTIVKSGPVLCLEGTDRIAGSSITLIECVNNFIQWSSEPIAKALRSVTATPAALLGIGHQKGCLDAGADADIVIISEEGAEAGRTQLLVDEVWKFGVRVHKREEVDRSEAGSLVAPRHETDMN